MFLQDRNVNYMKKYIGKIERKILMGIHQINSPVSKDEYCDVIKRLKTPLLSVCGPTTIESICNETDLKPYQVRTRLENLIRKDFIKVQEQRIDETTQCLYGLTIDGHKYVNSSIRKEWSKHFAKAQALQLSLLFSNDIKHAKGETL